MGSRLIFLHHEVGEEASRDGDGYASRLLVCPVQACRELLYDQKAEIILRCDESAKLRLRANSLIPNFQEKLRVEPFS